MEVRELVKCCYDEIIIYEATDDSDTDFKNLFQGEKEDIPEDLLKREIRVFGAKKERTMDIEVRRIDYGFKDFYRQH